MPLQPPPVADDEAATAELLEDEPTADEDEPTADEDEPTADEDEKLLEDEPVPVPEAAKADEALA